MMAAKKGNDLAPAPDQARDLPLDRGPVQGDRHQRRGGRGGPRPHPRDLHRPASWSRSGQADVAIFGIPYLGPYNVNSVMTRSWSTAWGSGTCSTCTGTNRSCARAASRSCTTRCRGSSTRSTTRATSTSSRRSGRHHDPKEIEAKFEERYARDPWYIHLYRTSHAYHGVHPFYMWYWGAHGRDHLGDVIFVGGEPKSVRRLGYRRRRLAARRARDGDRHRGVQPEDHVLHAPPLMIADVQ